MEGDAGASRLNPPPMPIFRRLRRRRPKAQQEAAAAADQTSPEATAEDSPESEVGADQTSPEATAEDSPESEVGADQTSPAGTAAASTETGDETGAEAVTEDTTETADGTGAEAVTVERGPSRLGRGWVAAIAAVLVLCAGVIGAGGYFALRFHHDSEAIARADTAALKAAVECVTATQAPDTQAMAASEQKIIECGTSDFRSQALLYTSMLVQAYQASNVHVQVSDVRAAVERNNNDGSVDVLVAMRVTVGSEQTQNETGYRLRVKMALDEGQYKIARLDQVTK